MQIQSRRFIRASKNVVTIGHLRILFSYGVFHVVDPQISIEKSREFTVARLRRAQIAVTQRNRIIEKLTPYTVFAFCFIQQMSVGIADGFSIYPAAASATGRWSGDLVFNYSGRAMGDG